MNTLSDLDYTLVEEVLKIGGVIKSSTDLSTGEVVFCHRDYQVADVLLNVDLAPVGVEAPGKPGAARGRDTLSTAHISPFVEWTAGASLLKVSRGIPQEQNGGGKRGKVKGFSFASRRRLMQTIARIRRDALLPDFVTLTYPSEFPSPIKSKKHLDKFLKRLRRAFPGVGLIWKLEPQERGAPHYHLLIWGSDQFELRKFIPYAWHDIAGDNDKNHLLFHLGMLGNEPCVNAVRSWRGVWAYASKYLGKTFDVAGWNEVYPGRFWAVVNPKIIPFGVHCVYSIASMKASHVMRYQKRFAKLRSRNYPSLTTFCDAEQWIKNIFLEVIKK
jgi:hypothetical protein